MATPTAPLNPLSCSDEPQFPRVKSVPHAARPRPARTQTVLFPCAPTGGQCAGRSPPGRVRWLSSSTATYWPPRYSFQFVGASSPGLSTDSLATTSRTGTRPRNCLRTSSAKYFSLVASTASARGRPPARFSNTGTSSAPSNSKRRDYEPHQSPYQFALERPGAAYSPARRFFCGSAGGQRRGGAPTRTLRFAVHGILSSVSRSCAAPSAANSRSIKIPARCRVCGHALGIPPAKAIGRAHGHEQTGQKSARHHQASSRRKHFLASTPAGFDQWTAARGKRRRDFPLLNCSRPVSPFKLSLDQRNRLAQNIALFHPPHRKS